MAGIGLLFLCGALVPLLLAKAALAHGQVSAPFYRYAADGLIIGVVFGCALAISQLSRFVPVNNPADNLSSSR